MASEHSVDGFPTDNVYKLGEIVCLKKTSVMYHVVGVSLYLGYDFCLWIYNLAKPVYHDAVVGDGPWRFGRCDIEMLKEVKEIDLMSAADAYQAKQEALQKQIKHAEEQLEKLRAEAAK